MSQASHMIGHLQVGWLLEPRNTNVAEKSSFVLSKSTHQNFVNVALLFSYILPQKQTCEHYAKFERMTPLFCNKHNMVWQHGIQIMEWLVLKSVLGKTGRLCLCIGHCWSLSGELERETFSGSISEIIQPLNAAFSCKANAKKEHKRLPSPL